MCPEGPRPLDELASELERMDGSGYGRYKGLRGTSWRLPDAVCEIDRVQADPYAPPSRLVVTVAPGAADLPEDLCGSRVRRRALGDHLARLAAGRLEGTAFRVDDGPQEVLERTACTVSPNGTIVLRLGLNLPAKGRRILGYKARDFLCADLPEAVDDTLFWEAIDPAEARAFVECIEDTDVLRGALEERGLVAFVGDDAVLPRRSGVDDRPLGGDGVVPFSSPDELRVTVELPNRGLVSGMGIPEGVTLVVGGGFHGKSTLLRALERGVYDHVPGDGRELVVARPDTVKIRSEDGRRVERVDIAAFVGDLPTGTDTSDFSTENASGSTSQAANIVEALEASAGVLLVDEDTSATNLMVRDLRMQRLISSEAEPLTPFVDLVRPLYTDHGVSTVLVMGGSGDYFDVADTVIAMEAFRPRVVTEEARRVASDHPGRSAEAAAFPHVRHRVPDPDTVDPTTRKGKTKLRPRGTEGIRFGTDEIDLGAVEQIVEPSQSIGVALCLAHLSREGHLDGKRTLAEALDLLEGELDEHGVDLLGRGWGGDFSLPRRFEVAAALNRLRSLGVSGFADLG